MRTKLISRIILVISLNTFSCSVLIASVADDTIRSANDSVGPSKNAENPDLLAPYHLNVIKFNPTPMMLFNELKNVTFSYERLIKKNKSVSMQLGYLVVPQVLNDTLFNTLLLNKDTRHGINLAFDYRVYPFSRNRRPAPDGLYYGGYASYYGCEFETKAHVMDAPEEDNVWLKGHSNMINLGFELGYQFILAKKFSIDLLMFGPSISGYWGNVDLTGTLNSALGDNLSGKIDEELAAKLKEQFPALGYLFSDEAATFSTSKIVLSSWFRYSIQFGYHF